MKKQLLLLLAATCIFAGLRAQSPVQRVFIQIDRDVYAPSGEVSFKAFLSKPADAAVKSSKLFVLILDPVGKPLVDKEFLVENNQAAGSLLLPDSTKEGEYRVLGYTDQMEYRPVTDAFSRKIMVRESKFPGLLIGLKLDASWYVRSESAQVGVHIVYQDGKPFKNGQFAYLASKNGVPYQNGISKTDEEGNDSFLIRIPATPEEGLLTLAVNTELGEFKGSSTISIPGGGIPVIMQFSPEGGTLIGGMSTVMGFRAGDIEGYPLKFEGVIVDRDNQPVDSIKSNSLGTGSIRFTPDPDDSLKVRISRPAGIDQLFPLPVAEPKGVQLLLKGRSESGLTFQVRTNIPRAGLRLSMTATYGGRSDVPVPFTLNDSLTWTVGVNQEIEGMVTVSIMNVEGVILAQRSVLVNPRNHRLSVSSGSGKGKSKELNNLNITLTGEDGQPTEGSVSVSVFDEVMSPACTREPDIRLWNLMGSAAQALPPGYFSDPAGIDEKMLDDLMLSIIDTTIGRTKQQAIRPFRERLIRYYQPDQVDWLISQIHCDRFFHQYFLSGDQDLPAFIRKNSNMLQESGLIPGKPTADDRIRQQLEIGVPMLSIIRSIKPYTLTNNQIYFSKGQNSLQYPKGALFVIDGVEKGYNADVINYYSPYDIATIKVSEKVSEILKYSADAGGLILITTKKGAGSGVPAPTNHRLYNPTLYWNPTFNITGTVPVVLNLPKPAMKTAWRVVVQGIDAKGNFLERTIKGSQ